MIKKSSFFLSIICLAILLSNTNFQNISAMEVRSQNEVQMQPYASNAIKKISKINIKSLAEKYGAVLEKAKIKTKEAAFWTIYNMVSILVFYALAQLGQTETEKDELFIGGMILHLVTNIMEHLFGTQNYQPPKPNNPEKIEPRKTSPSTQKNPEETWFDRRLYKSYLRKISAAFIKALKIAKQNKKSITAAIVIAGIADHTQSSILYLPPLIILAHELLRIFQDSLQTEDGTSLLEYIINNIEINACVPEEETCMVYYTLNGPDGHQGTWPVTPDREVAQNYPNPCDAIAECQGMPNVSPIPFSEVNLLLNRTILHLNNTLPQQPAILKVCTPAGIIIVVFTGGLAFVATIALIVGAMSGYITTDLMKNPQRENRALPEIDYDYTTDEETTEDSSQE